MNYSLSSLKYPIACLVLGACTSAASAKEATLHDDISSKNKIALTTSPVSDVFEKSENDYIDDELVDVSNIGNKIGLEPPPKKAKITPEGTTDSRVLASAPSPDIVVNGVDKKATIVVDLTTNVLYHYDNGKPLEAYSICSGKIAGKDPSPTPPGAYVVSHVEISPYDNAPNTKRSQNPSDYGPRVIILRVLDTKTGKTSQTGVFIHGNRNYSSLGKYWSHGCMRMDNKVIKYLSQRVKRGDIVYVLPNKNLVNKRKK